MKKSKRVLSVFLCLVVLLSGMFGVGALAVAKRGTSPRCVNGSHTDVRTNTYIAPTCTKNGYIGGVACVACSTIIEAPTIVPNTHSTITDNSAASTGYTASTVGAITCTNSSGIALSGCVSGVSYTDGSNGYVDNNCDGLCDICGCPPEWEFKTNVIDLLLRLFRQVFG